MALDDFVPDLDRGSALGKLAPVFMDDPLILFRIFLKFAGRISLFPPPA
jgi:hypothetical protein